jgi:hypothetical protein
LNVAKTMTESTSEPTSKRLALFDQMIAKGSVDPFALEAFAGVATRFPDYVPTYLMAAQVCAELTREADALVWCDRGILAAKKVGDAHALGELQAFRAEVE